MRVAIVGEAKIANDCYTHTNVNFFAAALDKPFFTAYINDILKMATNRTGGTTYGAFSSCGEGGCRKRGCACPEVPRERRGV